MVAHGPGARYRPGQLTNPADYATPLSVSNALRSLNREGLVENYTRYTRRGIRSRGGADVVVNYYWLTPAGEALARATQRPDHT
jgi:DNA-binding MarR family transcriptional regulator